MIGRIRWRFRSVTSTQDIAFHLAETGATSGTVVRADYQSAGRGRLGRSWNAPPRTSLTFSILLRPQLLVHQLGTLSIQTAHALCQVFTEAGVPDVALKWPNDVLSAGLKVSGILVQTRLMPDPVAVIGIGVNVNTALQSLPPTATSLANQLGHEVDTEALFDQILRAFDSMIGALEPTLSAPAIEELDRLLWLHGEPVSLLDADRQITGTILGIAPNGGLRLLTNGTERAFLAGEITRGPRPIEPGDES